MRSRVGANGPAGGGSGLLAPAVNTTQTNDQVVRLFGTGATGFTVGSQLPFVSPALRRPPGSTMQRSRAVGRAVPRRLRAVPVDNWVAQTVAIREDRTSIQISRPATALANDFLLVSVTAEGLGTGSICGAAGWTQVVKTTQGSGATSVTQATFSKHPGRGPRDLHLHLCHRDDVRDGVAAQCRRHGSRGQVHRGRFGEPQSTPSAAGPTGSAKPGHHRDRALRYDDPGVLDQVVSFYGTGATSFTGGARLLAGRASTATGVEAAPALTVGATGTATATSGSSANWAGQTIALTNDQGGLMSSAHQLRRPATSCSSR